MLDLSGDWSLVDASGDYGCALSLPGDGITALHAAGQIPDPYWGRNEYDLRWICERDWTASRTFSLSQTDVHLVLSEVDTIATVTVNGQVVLNADNAFREWRVDLSSVAKLGDNDISITFHSPVVAGKAAQDAYPFEVPWSKNCPIPYGNFLRKPACDFGWDWNIALAPFGVYGALRIEPAKADRIDAIMVHQDHRDGAVDVTFAAHVAGEATEATFVFAGQEVTTFVVAGVATVTMTVDAPDLWWPAGHGAQTLYDLAVTAGGATASRRIGLREMTLVSEPDDIGRSFIVRVNGRDIFCKGANWIPADALPGRITDAKTRALLQSAIDANMNMVRVWGGGRYEPTSFYDACDELGLLVWQDFMFACNLYPSDRAFVANVRAEVADNVRRMHHHASIALWCGDNELVGALGWYTVSVEDRDRYLVNYDRLNRAIEDALLDTDPHANWWPSSPTPGPMSFGDAWHDDTSGDMHFWSVWHEGRDFDHYRDVLPRFCSEFGFQSYPSMSAIRQFTDAPDRNIAAPVFEAHQKNEGGNARIAETMFRYFRWPERFDDFVYVSQVQQAEAIKTAVTHWRAHAPRCMGALIWQLNDTWPVCSWASLNHDGEWKLMHYAARDFFAPLLVTAVPDGSDIAVRAACDGPDPVTIAVTAEALALDGSRRPLAEASAVAGPAAQEIVRLGVSELRDGEVLLLGWSGQDGSSGSDVYAPRPWKTYDLPSATLSQDIRVDGDAHRITLSSDAVALFVQIEADVPGHFSANGMHVLPGVPVELTFQPAESGATPTFILRDLSSATSPSET